MKIVFSTDQTYLHGGIEKVLTEKANFLSNQKDYEVYIITTEQKGNKSCYKLNSNVKCLDLQINYNRKLSYYHPKNLIKAFLHFRKQIKIIKEIKPSIIISSNYAPDFYWLPFIFRNVPKWKEYHASRYFEVLNFKKTKSQLFKIKFQFENWIALKYHKIVVLNEDEKKIHAKNNVIVIPNPINSLSFTPKTELNSKRVIAAGRIAPVKGFEKLILAWENVSKIYPDWELHIYGEDYNNTKSSLEKLIQEKKLQDYIMFKGTTQNMTQTMLDYSIFAMSSQTECFPMVLLEALSVGLPIVSFNCETGPRNIFEHQKEGLLVKNQNIEEFSHALGILMSNTELLKEMGENAKKTSFKFDLEIVMKKWVNEIENSIKK